MTLLAELIADGAAGYWPLDETSGTVATDMSGNGRNGTYNGSPGFVTTGPAGTRAVDFPNSSATYVSIADNNAWSASSFTIDAWVNPDVVNTEMTWLSKFPNADPGAEWNFWMSSGPGNPFVDVHRSAGGVPFLRYIGANNTVVAGEWQMMTMKMDGGTNTVSLYRNAVFIGSSSTTSGTRHPNDTAPVMIGKRGLNADPRPMNGRLAHLAYVPSALSDARILAHYEALFPPEVPPEEEDEVSVNTLPRAGFIPIV